MAHVGGKVLGIVPARAGSTRLPGKNTRVIAGKPLIAWTIEAGLSARSIDRLMLSSDDDDAIEIARSLGCEVPFKRPNHLATSDASSADVVLHLLDETGVEADGFEWLALLQPTSPLRTATDIDAAFDLLRETGAGSCIGVSKLPKPRGFFGYAHGGQFSMDAFSFSPEAEPFLVNGAIYLTNIAEFRRTRQFSGPQSAVYFMDYERSIDIDEPFEFTLAEALLQARDT